MNRLVLLDGNKISGGINYITPECYSTEEREVGCWVDGKPLYQKSVATGGSVPSGATLIQRIVQTEYDTLLYTKTTDTAGSGTWTPQGVPTHHYSTDEHIVGTYLGETLYEKTWDFDSDITIPSSVWTDTTIKVSDYDIDKIVDIKATNSSGTGWNVFSANTDQTYVQLLQTRLNSGAITLRYLTLQYTKTS